MKPYFPMKAKQLNIWILWRLETTVDGKKGKIPYSASCPCKASSTNSNTWTNFKKASEILREHPGKYDGIGIAVSKEHHIIFIDIDHCISEDGTINAIGQDIINAFGNTYIEKSQSGTGVHILCFGEIPKSFKNSKNGVEIYNHARFCAMTGDAINCSDIAESQEALNYVYSKYKLPDRAKFEHKNMISKLDKSEAWIIEKASQNSSKFENLYHGNWKQMGYKSQSEADSALCVILAFWTDADYMLIDRIFRSSALYRDKWEREDYRRGTIENACSLIKETVSEYMNRRQREEVKRIESSFVQEW